MSGRGRVLGRRWPGGGGSGHVSEMVCTGAEQELALKKEAFFPMVSFEGNYGPIRPICTVLA